MDTCTECDGTGKIETEDYIAACTNCNGTGKACDHDFRKTGGGSEFGPNVRCKKCGETGYGSETDPEW